VGSYGAWGWLKRAAIGERWGDGEEEEAADGDRRGGRAGLEWAGEQRGGRVAQ